MVHARPETGKGGKLIAWEDFRAFQCDGFVKSHISDSFVKSSRSRLANREE
jgi:hypothetical protein